MCLRLVPVFTANHLHSEWMAIALLSLATAAHQGWSSNLFTTASDMFSMRTVAAVVGIGTSAGSIGGMMIAGAAGWILQLTHSYNSLFITAPARIWSRYCSLWRWRPDSKKRNLPHEIVLGSQFAAHL